MPRLLALGHVTWDRAPAADVLGGSAAYAALAVRRLGWEAGVVTSAGPEFDPARELPGIDTFLTRGEATTRFTNTYAADGTRQQVLEARAPDVDVALAPDAWRAPDALLLAGVADELPPHAARAFEAGVVGALAQGYVRAFDAEGGVRPRAWRDPGADLAGVHVLFLSEHDLGGADVEARARELLRVVPIVALTRGWRGVTLLARHATHEIPSLPRPEVDPTGAGDVFAASFLVGYHETGDPLQAAAFACCAASCAVEGVGATTLGDRAEIERRLAQRERLIEDGEWED
jgi:sugar/nucleoside kinase (ribokinase family)